MRPDIALWDGLPALLRAARVDTPVRWLGLLQPDDAGHFVVTFADRMGVAMARVAAADLPAVLAQAAATRTRACLTHGADWWRPDGFIENAVFMAGYAEPIRSRGEVRQAIAEPIGDAHPGAILLTGLAHDDAVGAEDAGAIDRLRTRVASLVGGAEPPAIELERLRRLELIDEQLPSLLRTLDVRETFARLSVLTRDVMAHDILGLGFFSDDRREVETYAMASASPMMTRRTHAYPPSFLERWVCNAIEDLCDHPVERDEPLAHAGMRSAIRFAIRLDDNVFGGLSFNSREAARYTAIDLAVGRRIADYVGLVLSYQRLAEQARQSEALRSRAATIELLRDLLRTATGDGDLPQVWSRVSALAQKVLPHDGLFLTAVLPNKTQARVYASVAPDHARLPDIVDVPAGIIHNDDWQYQMFDDLHADPIQQHGQAAGAGYRSALRVPIRLDGEYVAGVSFLSLSPSQYSLPDVAVARSVADGLTAQFIRERRQATTRRADEAAERVAALEARVRALTEELNARAGFHRVIGASPPWKKVLTQATQVGATETTVLLLGESGTGKEVVARFIHRASPRGKGPFVALNCAALPEHLLEAELFGYERGAFTGAHQSKPGQLEQAAGGTLFLDEVGEMAPNAQAKFLRVLQEREFQRLGGTRVLRADVRVVAATNRDLETAIARQQFREDLYYRLNVFAIHLPPLRERRDDLLLLSQALIEDLGRTLGRPPAGVAQDARRALLDYHWPGNVRELRNILERAAILADGGLIVAEHLAFRTSPRPPGPAPAIVAAPERADLPAVERAMIENAMTTARYNKSKAAKQLGLTRAQLYAKLRRHGLA